MKKRFGFFSVYESRPSNDEGFWAWCNVCGGFVVALGSRCIREDTHIVDFLSPAERNEVALPGGSEVEEFKK